MTRHELATDTANTLEALNEATRAALMLGRFPDVVDLAAALAHTANAYDCLDPQDDD